MSRATKSLGLLVFALALIVAVASWLLNDPGADGLEPGVGGATAAAAPDRSALAAPEAVDPAAPASAERTEVETPGADSAAAGAPASAVPTAEHLSGLVVDPSGRPIRGAAVSYGSREGVPFVGGRRFSVSLPGSMQQAGVVRTTTGEDGAFRLEQVARGENLELRVDHPDYVVVTRHDLIVPEQGMQVGTIRLEPGAAVAGHVFGPGGEKVEGATVSLRDPPGEDDPLNFFSMRFGPRGERTTQTDAEGRFRLTGMPPGRAVVVAQMEDYADSESEVIDLVAMQSHGGVVVSLERGHTITGLVRDPAGAPVKGANVHAMSSDGLYGFRRLMGGRDSAETDAEGRFSLRGLAEGTYTVNVDAEGFARETIADVDPASAAPLEISLGASAHVAGVVRFKGSGAPVEEVAVRLSPYWDGMDFSRMSIGPDSKNESTEAGEFLIQDVEPGRYVVIARGKGAAQGSSAPFTLEEDASVDDLSIELDRGAHVRGRVIDAATGAPLKEADVSCFQQRAEETFANQPGHRAMRVIGRRFASPSIQLDVDRQQFGRARTDGEGRFEIAHLPPGDYEIEADHADFAPTRATAAAVELAEERDLGDVVLGPGGSVEGAVLAIDGSPRPGDRIEVESKALPGVTGSAVADANGWYRVDHLPPGEALVTRSEADDSGGGRDMVMVFQAVIEGAAAEEDKGKPVTIVEGEAVRVDFSQAEKPSLEGVVTCADGAVEGVTVTAMPAGQAGFFMLGGQKEAQTGPDGYFRITDLDPGPWQLTARHPQAMVPVRGEVELVAGAPARHDFFLEGGVIEGTVLAQKGGAAIEGAIVSLERITSEGGGGGASAYVSTFTTGIEMRISGRGRNFPAPGIRLGGGPGGANALVKSGGDGRYRIPWVPAGKYRVSVRKGGFVAASSAEVEIEANGHAPGVDVRMAPAALLDVRVLSKATGEPIEGAPVQLSMESGGSRFQMTDERGIASFDDLDPGTWTASVRRSFQESEGAERSIACEAEVTQELTIDA